VGEAKQTEPSYEYHRNMATFMAADSHFIRCGPIIWLDSYLVLVVIAFCRVKKQQHRGIAQGICEATGGRASSFR
jgi:hypothetical protein